MVLKNILSILPALFLASFSPILASVIVFIYIINRAESSNESNDYLVFFAAACFIMTIAMINSVKLPENDLLSYETTYSMCSDFSFFNYLFVGSLAADMVATGQTSFKEPFYSALTWVLYHILFGDVTLFKFVLTLLNYALLTNSVRIFCKANKYPVWMEVVGIFLMCFIPYIFTMSMHLLRQFLAGSILVYLTINKCYCNWNLMKTAVGSLIMVLTHSTAFLFLPFLFFDFFEKGFKKNKVLYIISGLVLLSLQKVISIVSGGIGVSESSYVLSRASQATNFDLGAMSYLMQALLCVLIIIAAFFSSKDSGYVKNGNTRLSSLVIFTSIFILANINQSELSNRYAFYLYPIFPFLLLFVFKYFKFKKTTVSFICLIIFVGFIIYVYNGAWHYKMPFDFIAAPMWLFYI